MPVLGLTGGIATGKSTFSRHFLQVYPATFYDSDASVHALLADDLDVRKAIHDAFGETVCDSSGRPDRKLLRDKVYSDQKARRDLEEILHPRIRQQWQDHAKQARKEAGSVLIDIPLLYETDVAASFDSVIVVACSRETQMQRLTAERGLDPKLAETIITAQLDLRKKIQLADHLIWNDSTVPNLDGQARLLAACLHQRFA